MNSQIITNNEEQNNQMTNNDELNQLNLRQNQQQALQQLELMLVNLGNEIDQIVQNQKPQLPGQLQNNLIEQKAHLKLFLNSQVFDFVYYIIEMSLLIVCYSENDKLSMLNSMFIVLIVLDIVTIIEKIDIIYNAFKYLNYANEGLMPFEIQIGRSQGLEYIEKETKLRNTHLLIFSQLRKLFEFGSYLYTSITFYSNISIIYEESQSIFVFMIIYLIFRSFILVKDIFDILKSGGKYFQSSPITYQDLNVEKNIAILSGFVNLVEIIYLIVIIIINEAQCQGFNDFFYISMIVNLIFIIRRIQEIVTLNSQIKQNIQVQDSKWQFDTSKITFKEVLLHLFPVLFTFNFIICCIAISQNIDSQCKLGDSDFNLQWSYALYLLIYRGLVIGILTILSIFIIIGFLVMQVSSNYVSALGKSFHHYDKILSLKQETVIDKISEENLCIICSKEFVNGESYIRLKCNVDHIYHKRCIFDWIISRPSCPKCRVLI